MEKAMVDVESCPASRCEGCRLFAHSKCKWLSRRTLSANSNKLLLIEPSRNQIHIGGLEDDFPVVPPWKGGNWYSISVDDKTLDKLHTCIDVYRVGSYLSFFYHNGFGRLYKSVPILESSLERGLMANLKEEIRVSHSIRFFQRESINESIARKADLLLQDARRRFPEIADETLQRVSRLVAHSDTVLYPIMPLILDDMVEEIYFDSPGQCIYFDHALHGRCSSQLSFMGEELERIATLLRLESNMHLDNKNPSLKTDITILGNNLRVTAITKPLARNGFSLSLRRMKKNPFSLIDLISNGTLTHQVAAALLLAVSNRMNITITGAPGSGKTTLLNALDATTPKGWRKVYIEDAVESRLLDDHHQLHLCVDPVDELEGVLSKSGEIIKTLHRSPDYVLLGEIQTIEHSRALFEALAAGLHSIQTCHADSASGLISRWSLNHNICSANLAMMDVIVTLHRPIPGSSRRIVKELAEVRRKSENGMIHFEGINTLYSMNDSQGSLHWCDDGAFLLAANNAGNESHLDTYDYILDRMSGVDNLDFTQSRLKDIVKRGNFVLDEI